jgi:hypothetical protein
MKKIIYFLVLFVLIQTGCSNDSYDDSIKNLQDNVDPAAIMAELKSKVVYEGAWTVNQQVVDTARMETNGETLIVRLPEEFLLAAINSFMKPQGMPTTYTLEYQGYSSEALFMDFTQTRSNAPSSTPFHNGSFNAYMDGQQYVVGLRSNMNGTLVYRISNGQFTIGVPVNHVIIKNLETGEQTEQDIPAITLYYNTTKRIR